MRSVRALLLMLGTVLFAALLIRVGPEAVASLLAQLSWYLALIVVFPYGLMTTLDTLGWRFAFQRDAVPFRSLLAARLAGEAFNMTTPTASVGGEAVKAWFIRPYVPLAESLPSVVIAKTTITIAQALYLATGLVVAMTVLPRTSTLLQIMQWLLGLEILGVGGFVAVQVFGLLGAGGRMLQRLGLLAPTGGAQLMGQMDSALAHFYRDQPGRLVLSVTCHYLGWVLGALEAYLILWALGLPVSLSTAVLIDAFGSGVGFAAFLVPARLGAAEAGQVAVFMALGLGAPAGLTFALAQRVREAAWTGIGFLALTTLRSTAPPVARPTFEVER
jgi:glycosyltransferase 2 family protein